MAVNMKVNSNEDLLKDKNLEEAYTSLYRYCLFLTRNKWQAEDLAQDAMYKALRHYQEHSDAITPALLKKIAYNQWVDYVRKNRLETITNTEIIEDKDLKNVLEPSIILELASKLTSKQLIIFTLKEAFQYRISEIANLLCMSETAVKGMLNRVRTKLLHLSEEDLKAGKTTYTHNEALVETISEIIQEQDPSKLIRSLPGTLSNEAKTSNRKLPSFNKKQFVKTHSSPTCSLSMAA
ncbi:MAG: hypothetical protein LRY73_20140 [Bacillus sp. (in: Bacteria)]|nr:hypothetical protein [Bacillus sp. (in: firmicutes)]